MSLNLLDDNREALELLDWFVLTDSMAILSHFEKTKRRLQSTPRAQSAESIEQDLNRLEIFIKNYDDFTVVVNSKLKMLPDAESFYQLIPDISKGKFFTASELNFFALLIETYSACAPNFKSIDFRESFTFSADLLTRLKRLFVHPLREFVDPSGNTSYERHPILKKLYAEVLALENDLRVSIQKAAKTDLYSSRLQMDTYDIINDRYVLAVRSDSYHSELGPIIARSQSGMTLFVEPYDIRDKSNRRVFLLSEIEATILRLSIDLSKAIHSFQPEIQFFGHWLLELDWLHTKATYSVKLGLTKPILSKNFHFELHGLFHPLLSNPIKNNIHLDRTHKGLIISGPNTGGKTVALKSLCLSVLFLHLGLFLPAAHAEIFPVQDLFYFSHDHQNLAEGLSSFASESKYYLSLLKALNDKNLIIIDEIFNSTSSEEASALAIAFLEEIHRRSTSKIVLSTHHQVLKTFMHARTDYVSAHVGFDFELNRPTYKLILGEPGSSLAFKIFENLSLQYNLPNTISDKARLMLDQKQVTYESLLQELSQKKIDLDKLLNSNRSLNLELKNQKASMEGILFLEREKILSDYSKKIKHFFSQAENILEETKRGEITNRRQLNNKMGDIQSALNKETPTKSLNNDSSDIYGHLKPIAFEEITLNMTLFSVVVKKNIKVVQVNPRKKEVQIQHGVLSVWVSPQTLRWPSGTKPSSTPRVQIHIDRTVKGELEIDCRGMRLEEFQKSCEFAIEEVYSGEIPFVTIIHGHGDGILKNWLRNHLKKEYKDLRWENIEGNDGCTKIFI